VKNSEDSKKIKHVGGTGGPQEERAHEKGHKEEQMQPFHDAQCKKHSV
jgi:hypothetical protein